MNIEIDEDTMLGVLLDAADSDQLDFIPQGYKVVNIRLVDMQGNPVECVVKIDIMREEAIAAQPLPVVEDDLEVPEQALLEGEFSLDDF